MTRPLRIEYPGALHHVMSRGDNRQGIYLNDHDRERFFDIYSNIVDRLSWATYAWCLMGNHFHLVVETPEPNLSEGMRLLNGIYTQYFNKNHGRVGHLFQGRFHSIVVEKNRYLLELIRYVVLNPVRSGRVNDPEIGAGAATGQQQIWKSVRIGSILTGSWSSCPKVAVAGKTEEGSI